MQQNYQTDDPSQQSEQMQELQLLICCATRLPSQQSGVDTAETI